MTIPYPRMTALLAVILPAMAQASAGQLDNFKKAFSVCLEAKKYMVKY